MRDTLQKCDIQGYLEEESSLPFFRTIKLQGCIRSVPIEADFVSQIREDAILGMPFLKKHECQINFENTTLRLANQELACTDRYGRLQSNAPVVVRQVIPRSETLVTTKTTNRSYVLVEGGNFPVSVATCISTPDGSWWITIRCINPANQPLQLGAGTVVRYYTAMEETDIQKGLSEEGEIEAETERLPPHIRTLWVMELIKKMLCRKYSPSTPTYSARATEI